MSVASPLSSPSLSLSQGVGATLQPGQARILRVPAAGTLRVTQGALWVTRRGTRAGHAPDDLYVAPEQPLCLRAGETVVIEPIHRSGTPASRLAPATFQWQAGTGRCAGALRWLGARLGAWRHPTHARA